jgi:hypothetical protein
MISSGANTPPEVPDPSAMAQTSALTTISPKTTEPNSSPRSSEWIVP